MTRRPRLKGPKTPKPGRNSLGQLLPGRLPVCGKSWKPGQSGNPTIKAKEPPPGALGHVRELAAQGRSLVTIGEQACGMSQHTFAKLRREQPEFQEAIDSGRAAAEDQMYDQLRRIARGGKGYAPALMFILKCRHGWRETDVLQEQRPQNLVAIIQQTLRAATATTTEPATTATGLAPSRNGSGATGLGH